MHCLVHQKAQIPVQS